MSQAKSDLYYAAIIGGLSSANRGNVFLSKADAFALLNLYRSAK